MKRWKKISAWILGLGMAVAMLGTSPESVNAARQEKGSITVHKFLVESQDQYNELANSAEKADGQQIDIYQNDTLKGLRPLDNVGFTLTRMIDEAGITVDTAQVDTKNPYAETEYTDTNGDLTFADLPLGLYKLEELEDTRVKEPMKPVLISVPTYNPKFKTGESSQEFLYDIYVYPKNLSHQGGPDIEKDVIQEENNDGTVNIGQDFEWIIRTDIPADVKDDNTVPKQYIIYDILDSRLDFAEVKSVKIRDKDKANEIPFTEGDDYKFERKDVTGQPEDSGRSLTWTLTEAGLKKLPQCSGGQVVITFTTRLNDTADLGMAIPNSANLDYINSSGDRYTPNSDEPGVHTGGISILKLDKSDKKTKLAGAEFKIYTSENDAKNETNAVKKRNEKGELEDYVAVSSDEGVATFSGLAYGQTGDKVQAGKTNYWIVETKAPTGYNRLHDPVMVTVNATSHDAPSATYTIYNAKDNYELPFTGGTGILIFLIGGAVLFGVSYLVSGRKKTTK